MRRDESCLAWFRGAGVPCRYLYMAIETIHPIKDDQVVTRSKWKPGSFAVICNNLAIWCSADGFLVQFLSQFLSQFHRGRWGRQGYVCRLVPNPAANTYGVSLTLARATLVP